MQTKKNKKWIFINDVQNNIMFYDADEPWFFKQCDLIFMDGTFSSYSFPFKQLFVIHWYKNKNSSYVPLLSILYINFTDK